MTDEISEINAAAVKHMSETFGWSEFEKELNLMIEDLRSLLEQSNEDDERNRGRIDAFRTILAWPETVADASYGQNITIESDDAD